MKAYSLSFDFREPYQVLLDAEAIRAASGFKMRLGAMLETTLHGAIKPMITQCCIRHLYDHRTTTPAERAAKESWIDVAKSAERRRCGHHELEKPLSALECLLSVVDPKGTGTNKNRYVVASQEREVREKMRDIVGVPLVYMRRSVMILEPMGARSEETRSQEERAKIRAGLKGRRGKDVPTLKRKREDDEDDKTGTEDAERAVTKKSKTKGPKGPNPLSMKKPKDKTKAREQSKLGSANEEEKSLLRKIGKGDPQAGEEALHRDAHRDIDDHDNVTEGSRKRKRKRKHKDQIDDRTKSES